MMNRMKNKASQLNLFGNAQKSKPPPPQEEPADCRRKSYLHLKRLWHTLEQHPSPDLTQEDLEYSRITVGNLETAHGSFPEFFSPCQPGFIRDHPVDPSYEGNKIGMTVMKNAGRCHPPFDGSSFHFSSSLCSALLFGFAALKRITGDGRATLSKSKGWKKA